MRSAGAVDNRADVDGHVERSISTRASVRFVVAWVRQTAKALALTTLEGGHGDLGRVEDAVRRRSIGRSAAAAPTRANALDQGDRRRNIPALGHMRAEGDAMTISARHGVVGLTIAAVLVTAACTDPAAPPTTTTAAPTTATPVTTMSTTTAADPQLAGAEAAVMELWRLVDALGADPKRSLDELTVVARDQSLDTWRELLTSQRRRGYTQTGRISIVRQRRHRGRASSPSTRASTSAGPTSSTRTASPWSLTTALPKCATPPWSSKALTERST